MPIRMLGESVTVACINHPHDPQNPQASSMFKYTEDDFVLQAVDRSEGPCALRKQALLVKVYACTVCGASNE